MNELERAALAALHVNWAPTKEDVWAPLTAHVDGLHDTPAHAVLAAFGEAATAKDGTNPLGVVITGTNGAGKTHMLRWVRTQVQRDGGYFFLAELRNGRDFWPNVVHSIVTGLRRGEVAGENQLRRLVRRLADWIGASEELRQRLGGAAAPTRRALDEFIAALRRKDWRLGAECQHTARALLLLAAEDWTAQDAGESFLTSASEVTEGERSRWGLAPDTRPAQQVVDELSRLAARTGPSLLAVDQIDSLIDQSGQAADPRAGLSVTAEPSALPGQIGGGLMELRETFHRTVTVVACLPNSWEQIKKGAVVSVGDRFRQASRLAKIPSAEIGEALVEAHFAVRFARVDGFDPPYPTWPVLPAAFADAPQFTPRGLLRRIDSHISSCQANGAVVPLATLSDFPNTPSSAVPRGRRQALPAGRLAAVDQKFAAFTRSADISGALDFHTEDTEMSRLLNAGLEAWVTEQGSDETLYTVSAFTGPRPPLHAQLFKILDEVTEDGLRWSFRSLATTNYKAVALRLERARVISRVTPDRTKARVYLLLAETWAAGPKTRGKIDEFTAAGGLLVRTDPADLQTFAALAALQADGDPGLSEWLRLRRPASQTALFRAVFGDPGAVPDVPVDPRPPTPELGWPPGGHGGAPQEDPDLEIVAERSPEPVVDALLVLPFGALADAGGTVRVPLESLRKHTAIFAGSGSGKTVLIRRIVEECALRGVSSIVLDPNNDLARLGDAWPEPPRTWGPDDAARSDEYVTNTDVMVWTPRRAAGRPLSFQPLPDFAAVRDDPDELGLALDTAVATLAPRARIDGATAKADRGRAVLREALAYFARDGGRSGMQSFLELLAELPEDVTTLSKAAAMAEDMAQTLIAAMINDPLFGGAGAPLDPGVLLTPRPGKRARVSVISLIGLSSNEQRQSFVNQLQMALFAWIKQHPAGDRPLGGLFVMDEAQTLAPSGAMTACTESTLALASQARKYGLGLIFATQAPRGIHNRIVGNTATQFYGFLNSPTQIAAARELAQAKGSGVIEISRLTAGQFYAVGETMPFQKITTPMCLSHHPKSALTSEEVLLRAQVGD